MAKAGRRRVPEGIGLKRMDQGKGISSNIYAFKHPALLSLGDRGVVYKVLADMLKHAAEDPLNSVVGVKAGTKILTGKDPAYRALNSWNEDEIGGWIRGHMNGVPAQGGAEAAVEYALAHLVLHFIEATRAVTEGTATPEEAGRRMRSLIENWTNLMVGIPPQAGLRRSPPVH